MPPTHPARRGWRTLLTLGGAVVLVAAGASAASAANQLFWGNYGASGNSAGIAAVSGDGVTGGDLPVSGGGPNGTVIDAAAGKVYWAAYDDSEIRYSDLNGSNAGVLNTGNATIDCPYGLALDPAAGELYWANEAGCSGGSVEHAKTDGSGGGALYRQVDVPEMDSPYSPAVDPANNKIYWANYDDGAIGVANLDGTGAAHTITASGSCTVPSHALAVAVDSAKDTLFVQHLQGFFTIITMKMRLDGTGCEDLLTYSGSEPSGMTLDPERDRLISPDYNSGAIEYVDLTSGTIGSYVLPQGVTTSEAAYPAFIAPPTATTAPTITRAPESRSLTCGAPVWSDGIPGMFLFRSPSSGNSYSWARDGATVAGATSATLTADTTGAYACTVTASNGAGGGASTSAVENVTAVPSATPTGTVPAASSAGTESPAGSNLVKPVVPVATKAIGDGKVRTTLHLQYAQTGRFSFYLQDKTGMRVPLLRGSTVGTRVLRKTFSAPVVQDGQSGTVVTLRLITRPTLPAGSTLRVVLRQTSGSLAGESIPATK